MKGIQITAYETEVNSGIFKGTVMITEGQSTQNLIHVRDGDTITAKYPGSTPRVIGMQNQSITTTAFIGMNCPPLERVPASGINITDNEGNQQKTVLVNKQILIGSKLDNITIRNQTFAFIVQISDERQNVVSLSSVSGLLLPSQTFSPTISWIPPSAGKYAVNILVWQSINNPNSLSPPLLSAITVLPNVSTTATSFENLKCQTGYELVIKPGNNIPVCVTPETAKKLIARGWAKTEIANSDRTVIASNQIDIDLSNQTYEAGYPVNINLRNVNQDYGCKIPSVSVFDASNKSLVFGPTPERDYGHSHCTDPWHVTFYAGLENNSLVTKPTRYSVTAMLDNTTYQKEFTVLPSNYSGTSISSDSSQILPGFLTFTGCLPIQNMPPNNGTLTSYSGFDLYHRYLAGPDTGGMEFDDYLLRPGHTGSFVMQVHQGQFLPGHNLAGGLSFLSGNLLNVDNSTVWKLNRQVASEDHPGLDVSYFPIFAVAGPSGYATIAVSISAKQDAPQGSYWLHLPPGTCGGHRILLTVGDKPLAQPPDYIGYDFDSSFVVDTTNQLVFELINPGIHTFENCTLGYISENQTMTVKTFDVIPPGMEYKHIWNASSAPMDKRFLECKSPLITKVYPDMEIDGLPW
jgi:hypothetical protein